MGEKRGLFETLTIPGFSSQVVRSASMRRILKGRGRGRGPRLAELQNLCLLLLFSKALQSIDSQFYGVLLRLQTNIDMCRTVFIIFSFALALICAQSTSSTPSLTSTNLLGVSCASYGLSSYCIAGGACCPDSTCCGIGMRCIASSTTSGYDCEESNQSSSVRNPNIHFRSSLRVPHHLGCAFSLWSLVKR